MSSVSTLLLEYDRSLHHYALRLTRNLPDAEDLHQDTIVRALNAQGTFQEGTDFRAWAFTVMRNHFLNVQVRRARMTPLEDRLAATLDTPETQEHRVLLRQFGEAIEALPAEQRQAITLVAINGLTYRAAARASRCAIGTIKSRIARGRQALLALSDRELPAPGWNEGSPLN